MKMMSLAVCTWLVIRVTEPGEERLLLGLLLGSIIAKLDIFEVLVSDGLGSVESVGTNGRSG
jgi:hypothetical protein